MERRGCVGGITIYDDFAHHPTAIETTLQGLRRKVGSEKIMAVIEPRSNTMKSGIHQGELNAACQAADMIVWFKPDQSGINFQQLLEESETPAYAFDEVDQIVRYLEENSLPGTIL